MASDLSLAEVVAEGRRVQEDAIRSSRRCGRDVAVTVSLGALDTLMDAAEHVVAAEARIRELEQALEAAAEQDWRDESITGLIAAVRAYLDGDGDVDLRGALRRVEASAERVRVILLSALAAVEKESPGD